MIFDMKKQYIVPDYEAFDISVEDIICTSPILTDESSDTSKMNLSKQRGVLDELLDEEE